MLKFLMRRTALFCLVHVTRILLGLLTGVKLKTKFLPNELIDSFLQVVSRKLFVFVFVFL
jgi:hypothetical protein